MASRYRVTCKMCRREGISVCGRDRCAAKRRNQPPGIHGSKGFGKLTPYGAQLREKQKVKRSYGLRERQFRGYYAKAIARRGNTGEMMGRALEMRLDTVVARAGFASTQFQARQLVGHGHITVNGRRVDVPSYETRPGDVVAIRKKGNDAIPAGIEAVISSNKQRRSLSGWLARDDQSFQATVVRAPEAGELPPEFNLRTIVEFYSR